MRAIVDAGDLYRALREVSKAAPRKTTLPVLYNVLMEAEPGALRLTCRDLGDNWSGISRTIPARGAIVGATTVPAKFLRNLAQVWAKSGPMLLEEEVQAGFVFDPTHPYHHEAHSLLVKVQAFNFTAHIVAIRAEDYPPIPAALEVAA